MHTEEYTLQAVQALKLMGISQVSSDLTDTTLIKDRWYMISLHTLQI